MLSSLTVHNTGEMRGTKKMAENAYKASSKLPRPANKDKGQNQTKLYQSAI